MLSSNAVRFSVKANPILSEYNKENRTEINLIHTHKFLVLANSSSVSSCHQLKNCAEQSYTATLTSCSPKWLRSNVSAQSYSFSVKLRWLSHNENVGIAYTYWYSQTRLAPITTCEHTNIHHWEWIHLQSTGLERRLVTVSYCHVVCVTIDGVWISEWIYWPLTWLC
jgi:hypothetical protein